MGIRNVPDCGDARQSPPSANVFHRHLQLRGGRAKCPFCDVEGQKRPSLAVRGELWFCHRCARGGNALQFARLVGELPPQERRVSRNPLDDARHELIARAERKADEWWFIHEWCPTVRDYARALEQIRQRAAVQGDDASLQRVAHLESELANLDAAEVQAPGITW
jgi:hypothetical protein